MPLAPCVTEVTARPAFSKLSALPPPTPVIALKLTAVSSLVDTVSSTMSATAVTVSATVLETAGATPSLVVKVSAAAPL